MASSTSFLSPPSVSSAATTINNAGLQSLNQNRDASLSPSASRSKTVPRARSTASMTSSLSTPSLAAPLRSTRPFRSIIGKKGTTTKWVTREIAALEFLQTGIPMAKEGSIVHEGWTRQHLGDAARIDAKDDSWRKQKRGEIEHSRTIIETDEHKDDENDTIEEEDYPPISPSLMPLNDIPKNNNSGFGLVRQGRWWEKWIVGQAPSNQQEQPQERQKDDVGVSRDSKIEDLEEPDEQEQQQPKQHQQQQLALHTTATAPIYAPGRRLEGDIAVKVQIPLANTLPENIDSSHHRKNSDIVSLQSTKHQSIARMAMTREWELRVAHGLKERHLHPHSDHHHTTTNNNNNTPAMLDGRMYMSAKESYPMMVYSLLRYEPKKEEAVRRRQKLEERGGGGTQFFIMPSRDWRGISFRALLPVSTQKPSDDISDNHDIPEESVKNDLNSSNNPRLLFDRFAARRTEFFIKSDNVLQTSESKGNFGDEIPTDTNDEDGMDMDSDDSINDSDNETFAGDTYVAGLLDDPEMVQGRHRNVMIGDRGTGPIVSSTIQFVKPKLLKADLNKQFRERFDGYEPPESQRKFIKAKVVNGIYTLMDPTQELDDNDGNESAKDDDNDTIGANTTGTAGTPTTGATTATSSKSHRRRKDSTSSMSLSSVVGSSSIDGKGEGKKVIRMPPSLTLSKIRSLKQQALEAAVRARLEISTVALAIIYFERLCLDCRVDKSNRRLSFAACLLLAIKINEAHVGVITTHAMENTNTATSSSKKSRTSQRIQSLIRPNKKSSTMFASLLVFFTEEWNISLKHLFAAEWGVFAALQFRLTAKPSDVAFHFKRLMKTLAYDPRGYLGSQVYASWQQTLAEEEFRRQEWEVRVESRRQRKEERKLKQLQREIEEAAADRRGSMSGKSGASSMREEEGVYKDEESTEIVESTDIDTSQKGISSRSSNIPRRRRKFGDILKNRLSGGGSGVGGLEGLPKRSVSSDRSLPKRPGSTMDMDSSSSAAKNHTAPVFPLATGAAGPMKGQGHHIESRPRPPLLRPLSKSKSMLSLSAKGREMMIGKGSNHSTISGNNTNSIEMATEDGAPRSPMTKSPMRALAKGGRLRIVPPDDLNTINDKDDEDGIIF